MNNKLLRVTLMTLVLAAGGTALADDKNQPPLKGPKVPERHVPGVDNGLGTMESGGGDKKGVAREMPIPHAAFMRMLNEALGDGASEDVRLNAEQRAQVEKIGREFGERQRTYTETNRNEIEKLTQKYGTEVRQLTQRLMAARGGMPGDGKRPGKEGEKTGDKTGKPASETPDGMKSDHVGLSDEARAEVIAKLKELQAGAPKPEDARTAIWGVLKAEQQAAVQKKVDAFKAEREKQQDERYKEREKKKLEERGTKKSPVAPGAGEPAKPLDPARRAELLNQLPDDLKTSLGKLPEQAQNRLLARFAELPTERREEFYATVRERLKNSEGGGRPGKK